MSQGHYTRTDCAARCTVRCTAKWIYACCKAVAAQSIAQAPAQALFAHCMIRTKKRKGVRVATARQQDEKPRSSVRVTQRDTASQRAALLCTAMARPPLSIDATRGPRWQEPMKNLQNLAGVSHNSARFCAFRRSATKCCGMCEILQV